MRQEDPKSFKVIGKSFDKVDSKFILSGQPAYTEDFIPPRTLIVKAMRSPHAFAKIVKIDVEKAKKLPGIADIFTYKDVPNRRFTLAGQSYPEPSAYDMLILDQVVRYVGDEVALIVAEDEKTAKRAMSYIRVEYEVMDPVLDAKQAIGHPSVVHDEDNIHFNFDFVKPDVKRNIACSYHHKVGDIESALAECDYVVEESYFTQATEQSMMEPFKTYCHFDHFGRLVIISSTQVPFHVRRHVAWALGIPANKIRVIKPRIGGGFGAKQTLCTEIMCAFVAWKLQKPVAMIYDRHEAANCSTTRHARHWDVRIGATKDGIVQVIDMYALSDAGAYGSHAFTTFTAGEHKSVVLYNKGKAVGYCSDIVYTNHAAGGAFRGYGATEALWPLECAINELAHKMGVDPGELRLKNVIQVGEEPVGFKGHDEKLASGNFSEAIRKVMDMSGWNDRPHSWEIDETHRGGMGMAMALQGSGIAKIDTAAVDIRLSEEGFYTLYTGSTDMGTGANTVLIQIACEMLGCPFENMGIYEADTDVVPFDPGSYASSTTYVTGTAAKLAALDLKNKIIARFAKEFGVSEEEVEFDGVVGRTIDGTQEMTVSKLQTMLLARPDCEQLMGSATFGSHTSPPPFMVSVAEVSVNTETGKVTPLNFYGVLDVGTVINPKLARVQAEGGIVQGIGQALYEEVRYTDTGRLETNNFMLYKIPTRMDIGKVHVDFVSSYEPTGGVGAKSIVEVVINTSCPAIQDAIYAAVGVPLRELPMTAERVFMAMKEKNNR